MCTTCNVNLVLKAQDDRACLGFTPVDVVCPECGIRAGHYLKKKEKKND
jgi:predicted RNA-binding Zn-ribbon protein involved in translation (DUF1610 family)